MAALKEILRWIVFPSRISALNENNLYHFSTTWSKALTKYCWCKFSENDHDSFKRLMVCSTSEQGSNFVCESSSHGVAQLFFFRKTFHHNKISFKHARDISVIKHLFLQIRYRCSETAQITRATSRRPCTRVFPVSCTEKRAFYLCIGQSSSICDGRSSSKSLCWLLQAKPR